MVVAVVGIACTCLGYLYSYLYRVYKHHTPQRPENRKLFLKRVYGLEKSAVSSGLKRQAIKQQDFCKTAVELCSWLLVNWEN